MMTIRILILPLLLLAIVERAATARERSAPAAHRPSKSGSTVQLLAPAAISDLVRQAADSGRVVGCADSPSDRVNPPVLIAPGAPPVLSFRNFDAADRGRISQLGLMTDDAGH